jgi:hypothetical protein
MIIPILAMNRAKSIWGEDATEFRYALRCALPINIHYCYADRRDGSQSRKLRTRSRVYGATCSPSWQDPVPALGTGSRLSSRFNVYTRRWKRLIFFTFFSRMKALIFTLVRALEFELAVPAKDIVKKSAIVQRPVLLTDPDGGNQMPLLIKPYSRP